MANLLFIFCLIIFLLSVGGIRIVESLNGWCTHLKPVTKTRRLYLTKNVEVTKLNFWNNIRRNVIPTTYSISQVYTAQEFQRECCDGFVQHGNECKPICSDNCPKNSWCSEPNICTCSNGYEKDGTFCKPICENQCIEFAECIAPGKCDCWHGYEIKSVDNVNSCIPICTHGCPANSRCTKPDICECESGYAMSASNSECHPVCSEPCPENSTCYRPDECICADGFHMQRLPDIQPYCSPICSQNCSKYGKCIAPNTCECLPGYQMQQQSMPTNDTGICKPICSSGCSNGFCFTPELCVCNTGYLMGPDKICSPVCSFGCVNGVCVEPEICSCFPGFQFANNSVHRCVPQCEPPCINGNCEAPNVCICWRDYQPNGTHLYPKSEAEMDALTIASNVCIPTCTQTCINGICVAPNTCRCIKGYNVTQNVSIDNNQNSEDHCEPFCEGCNSGGDCIAPNICKCWPGYAHSRMENNTHICQLILGDLVDQSSAVGNTVKFEENIKTTVAHRNIFNEFHTLHLTTNFDCLADCICWVFDDELGVLNNAKCEHICKSTGDDVQCLDLQKCKCSSMTWEIICNASAIDKSEEDERTHYLCKQAKVISKKESVKNVYWIVGGIILICLTLCIIIFLTYRYKYRYQNEQRSNGEAIVEELYVLRNNLEGNENCDI